MKILLVEDDIKLGKTTRELLTYEKFFVDWAEDGNEAIRYIKENAITNYDAVILDWMLPELSGLDVCRLLRNKYNYQGGIIFVTAKGELDDCVRALNTGADDFVVKPYKIKELSARLNAVLRRKDKPFIDKIYQKGNIEINASLYTVQCDNTKIQLRKKEFALFEMLFVNLNNVLPRTSIFEKIWEDKMDTNMESLDSHIYMLRKSLKVFPNIQIKSIKNIGYKMEITQ
ncbi:MAG: response regulator transcription factor [Alphaproteobacteria bacterium]|nr:response regulator transcription factor [Alphaproteobacteria bacterium]